MARGKYLKILPAKGGLNALNTIEAVKRHGQDAATSHLCRFPKQILFGHDNKPERKIT